jgi:hypothetical protein
MKKWRSTLRNAPEVATPDQRTQTVSAQTLTESQEQGLRAEIIAARTRHELVTPQWVSSRAADIYRLGLYIDGAAPPVVSQEGDDDPLVDMPEPEAQRTWRTDEGSDGYWQMADEMLAPIVEAGCEEEEDAEFASDDHGDFIRLREQFGCAWFRGFSKRMGLSLLAAHPKRPEPDLADAELRLQIQRDVRLAIHNDRKWMNSFRALAVAESAKLGKTQVKAADALRHFLAAWEAIEAWNIAQAWSAILG